MIAAIRAFVRRHLELELDYRATMQTIRNIDTDIKEILS